MGCCFFSEDADSCPSICYYRNAIESKRVKMILLSQPTSRPSQLESHVTVKKLFP